MFLVTSVLLNDERRAEAARIDAAARYIWAAHHLRSWYERGQDAVDVGVS